jgi:hypothetical protein
MLLINILLPINMNLNKDKIISKPNNMDNTNNMNKLNKSDAQPYQPGILTQCITIPIPQEVLTKIVMENPEVNKFIQEYLELKKENNSLKDQLIKANSHSHYEETITKLESLTSENTALKNEIETLKTENTDLKMAIELLKKENEQLKNELSILKLKIITLEKHSDENKININKLEIKINDIVTENKINIDKLLIKINNMETENKIREQMILTSEIVTRYKKSVVDHIYGSSNNYKFGDIMSGKISLSTIQQNRLDEFKDKFDEDFYNGFVDFNDYLKEFCKERNMKTHKINKNMSDEDCRKEIHEYADSLGEDQDTTDNFKFVANLIIKELGKLPFKKSHLQPRRRKD